MSVPDEGHYQIAITTGKSQQTDGMFKFIIFYLQLRKLSSKKIAILHYNR
jgi:hypothetical protein